MSILSKSDSTRVELGPIGSYAELWSEVCSLIGIQQRIAELAGPPLASCSLHKQVSRFTRSTSNKAKESRDSVINVWLRCTLSNTIGFYCVFIFLFSILFSNSVSFLLQFWTSLCGYLAGNVSVKHVIVDWYQCNDCSDTPHQCHCTWVWL